MNDIWLLIIAIAVSAAFFVLLFVVQHVKWWAGSVIVVALYLAGVMWDHSPLHEIGSIWWLCMITAYTIGRNVVSRSSARSKETSNADDRTT